VSENVNVTGMRLRGNRQVPHGTIVEIRNIGSRTHVGATVQLPWQTKPTDLGEVPIENGEIVLPLTLAFLCHAKEDRTAVQDLGNRLLSDGILTWFDEKDLLPGDNWEAEIENAIERADAILVFLSAKSCEKTGYVQRELKYALKQRDRRPEHKRYVVPVLLEPCTPPRSLDELHQLRLWEPDAYEKLLAALGVRKAVAATIVRHAESVRNEQPRRSLREKAAKIAGAVTAEQRSAAFRFSAEGVRLARESAEKVIALLEALANEVSSEALPIRWKRYPPVVGGMLWTRGVSLAISWNPRYANSLDGSELAAKFWKGRPAMPNEFPPIETPTSISDEPYEFDLGERTPGWRRKKGDPILSAEELAEALMERLLDLSERYRRK